MSQNMAGRPVDGDGNWEKQTPRTIRFYDRDWVRIETHAVMRGMTAAELVRAAAIATVGEGAAVSGSDGQVVAQIERIFRYVHVLATAVRNERLKDGRGEELEKLVREARELLDELKKGRPD